jgi:hypothetical protein
MLVSTEAAFSAARGVFVALMVVAFSNASH